MRKSIDDKSREKDIEIKRREGLMENERWRRGPRVREIL